MSLQLTINLATADDVTRAVAALVAAGVLVQLGPGQALTGGNATGPAMPRPTALPQPAAMPHMPGPVTPPPPPAPTQPVSNPRLESVVKLMDAYSKANNNGVQGVRKVLAVIGIARAQDANEEQLVWLEQAFANTAWTPG